MKKKIALLVLLLIILVVEIAYLAFWLIHCKNFQEVLHVDFSTLALQLKGEAGQDSGVSLFITRFFHNKPVDAVLLVIKTYFRFWDFILFGKLFPFLGSFGILAAGYYFFASNVKRLRYWILFIIFLLLPFVELFFSAKIPFLIRIGLFYAFFGFISLFGIKKFIQSQRWSWVIVLILALISIWWFLVSDFNLATFCYQYPLV